MSSKYCDFQHFLMVVKPLKQPSKLQEIHLGEEILKIWVFMFGGKSHKSIFSFGGKSQKRFFRIFGFVHSLGFLDYSYFPFLGVTCWGHTVMSTGVSAKAGTLVREDLLLNQTDWQVLVQGYRTTRSIHLCGCLVVSLTCARVGIMAGLPTRSLRSAQLS